MTLSSKLVELSSLLTRTTSVNDSNGTDFSSTETYYPNRFRDELIVTNGGSKGNFKDPNSFSYLHFFDSYMAGTESSISMTREDPDFVSVSSVIDSGVFGYGTGAPTSPDPDSINSVYNAALSDLQEKLRGSIDLSVDLLQGGQARAMLKTAARYAEYVLAIPRGKYKAAFQDFNRRARSSTKSDAKWLGSKWLEYQYGLKPLAQDLYGTAKQMFETVPSLLKAEGKAHDVTVRTLTTDLSGIPRVTRVTSSNRCKFGCLYSMSDSTLSHISNFTSLNPVSIAWELMPYSFVVDWFVDIGGYIRNVESSILTGSGFRSGYYTETQLIEAKSTRSGGYSDTQTNGSTSVTNTYTVAMTGQSRYTRFGRVVLQENPFPRPPVFKANLGSGRLLNAAALLSQHLKA